MLAALLLPLFLIAGLGWLLARSRYLHQGWQSGLNEITAKVLIPVFLFSGAYKHGIPGTVSWQFLAAYFLPLIGLFVAAALLRREPGSVPRALAATYSNTVFVGIPVLSQAFGEGSLQYAFPVIAFHGLIAFSLYYLMIPLEGKGRTSIVGSLLNAVRNPIVASLLCGLALHWTGLALPAPVSAGLSMLSAAALPCALLALGASLAAFRLQRWPDTVATVVVKLMLLPACVLGMGMLFALPAPATAALVVIAACPVGVNAAALVQATGQPPALVSSAILLSSMFCIVSLPLWLGFVRTL